jgi:hypothetical protein
MPHWNLADAGSQNELEEETFEELAQRAAETYGIALHYKVYDVKLTEEERAEAELEAM